VSTPRRLDLSHSPLRPRSPTVARLLPALVALVVAGCAAAPRATSRDAAQEARIRAIVAHMTLAQKIGQMTQADIRAVTPDDVRRYYLGSVLDGGGAWPRNDKHAATADWLAMADAWWTASMQTDMAVKVPVIWGTDAVHGHNNVFGMTLFPHNIGLGAANDPALVERIGEAVARQVRATGIDWTFAPTVAVPRDDRWGRTYEGFSEDPAIVAAYAGRYVAGLQGRFEPGRPTIVATAKHFLGDGGTEGGVDQGENKASVDDLLRVHGAGYVSAIGAGVQTVMASFNSWTYTGQDDSGQPLSFVDAKNTGNRYLLTDLLKKRWGFDGLVVTDWDAIGQVSYRDSQGRIKACSNSSCPAAINAGIDMVMVPFAWKDFIAHTMASVQAGEIPLARIDDAVTRILRVKMRAGLFRVVDGVSVSTPPSQRAGARGPAAQPRALAREAVRKSLVLLKNNHGTLPLARAGRVLVVGRGADSIADQAGGWSLTWQGTGNSNADFPVGDSVLAGVREAVGAANVVYAADARGVDVKAFQAVIAVIGESPYAEGVGDIRRSSTLEHARRHPEDLAVLTRVAGQGVPVVTVLLSGRPLWVDPEINRSDAFVAAWLPGTEGKGIADVLFRHADGSVVDFAGRLSFSWPRNACQANVNKGDAAYDPLFPYGYGLTYAAAAHGELGLLDESPQPRRCGGPAAPATEDLVIFRQAEGPAHKLHIGSPADWRLPLGDDLNAVVATSDGAVRAETAQVNVQQDARKITFSGPGQFSADSTMGRDFSGWLGTRAVLAFDVVVDQAPAGAVQVRIGCGHGCGGAVDVTAAMRALPLRAKATLKIPLRCFADRGADFTAIDTPFALAADRPFAASFADIRWQVGADQDPQVLPCTPAPGS
jgi:beta-glucosidase